MTNLTIWNRWLTFIACYLTDFGTYIVKTGSVGLVDSACELVRDNTLPNCCLVPFYVAVWYVETNIMIGIRKVLNPF